MAVQAQAGCLSGTAESPSLPITVWDDAYDAITETAAIAAATTAAPSDIFGSPPDGPPTGVQQLSNSAWIITIVYRPLDLQKQKKPTPPPVGEGSVDYRFSFQAQPKFVYLAEECIEAYTAAGANAALRTLKVNVEEVGGLLRTKGMQVSPAPETFSLDLVLPNAVIDTAYKVRLAELCGCWNDATFLDYAAGQIQLVRASGQKRNDEDWRLSLGFGYRKNLTSIAVGGGITVASKPGHAIMWTRDEEVEDDDELLLEPRIAIVQRVWDLDDLTDVEVPS